MAILGAILAVLALLASFGFQAQHKRETGVNAPSRKTMAYLRRKARKNGITEDEAYEGWLARKQGATSSAGASLVADTTKPPRYEITSDGMEEGEARFSFHCLDCGGYILHVEDDPVTSTSLATCKACGQILGPLNAIEQRARDWLIRMGGKNLQGSVWRDEQGGAV